MIYAIANSKGGVGKSTTAVHLAVRLAASGPTLLIEGDTQPTTSSWAAWREDLTPRGPDPVVRSLAGADMMTTGRDLCREYENTVIDVGGRDTIALRAAVLLADMLIIPLSAGSFDSAALSDMQDIIKEANDYRSTLAVRILLTRLNRSARDLAEMLDYLNEQNLPVLKARILERVAVRRATGAGSTVHETGTDKKAMQEMADFFDEVTA